MFCPSCGEHNEVALAFCRQCGQALSDVALALERKPEQSLQELQLAQKWIKAGSATIIVFTLIGLAIAIVGLAVGRAELNYSAMINFLLGMFIGVPLLSAGKRNLKRSINLLSKAEAKPLEAITEAGRATHELLTTGSVKDRVPISSVTEGTTVNLQKVVRDRAQH